MSHQAMLMAANDAPAERASQARNWPFSVTLHHSPQAPGPVFAFKGIFEGVDTFHVVRQTLEFAFGMAGDLGPVGLDITGITRSDDLNLGQFVVAAMKRATAKGPCRLVVPMTSWGEKLLQWLMGYTLSIAPDHESGTVAVDVGIRGGE